MSLSPIELTLRLGLVPALIAAATLAGRRWGLAVGSWLAGLPIVSAPILCFCGAERGLAWTRDAAGAGLASTAAVAAFCVGYAWCARATPWWGALAGGYAAYAGCVLLLARLHLALWLDAAIAMLALAAAMRAYPLSPPPVRAAHGPWELPLRMAAAAAVVLAVTWGSAHAGPRLCGALTTFPTAAAVLGAFSHRASGAAGAVAIFRGLTVGMLSMSAFFLVVALGPGRYLWSDVACATAAALACHGLTLWCRRWLLPPREGATAPADPAVLRIGARHNHGPTRGSRQDGAR